MSRLDEIPTAFEAPAGAGPSAVVARLRAIRPSRRTMLRGLVIAAAAAALVPLDWYLHRREAAAQETDGDDMSEFKTCQPESYREEANNWPATGPAVCYGGWRRGGYPCEGGYHREGSYSDGEDTYESTRVTTSCHGRNAWRWNGYRCSDAMTTATFSDGTEYSGISIAACELPGDASDEPAAEEPTPEQTTPEETAEETAPEQSPEDSSSDSGEESSGSDDERRGGDPSRPRGLVPSLGSSSSMSSVPVLGSMLGAR